MRNSSNVGGNQSSSNAAESEQLTQDNVHHVIRQFQRKGFESLTLEDLAVATIRPDFTQSFKVATGQDWQSRFQVKAIERLNFAKFDLNWLTRKTDDSFKPLFANTLRGDLARVQSFVNSCPKDMNCMKAVDSTKKSPVHLAAADGHLSVLEFLVHKGFNVDSRDRTLKTPLHYACMNGHDTCADFLLKNGANIEARDSIGKNPIHFASTANSAQLVPLLVGIKPDIVFSTDNTGLTALHYAVWNVSQRQVDIVRTLLDYHADVNALDDDGKTALHHAAKGGKTRVIPILVQRGSDITIREKISKKTCMELAANDRTRELIIVYSSAPLSHTAGSTTKENTTWFNTALKGERLPIIPRPKQLTPSPPKKINPFNEDISAISSWIRGRFFKLMKKLQAEGIKNWHHLRKPYIYTGSWMEGIKNLEELYDLVKDIPPSEAIIRAFNILCPFDEPIPKGNGEEEAIDNFYGSSWYEGGSFNYSRRLETDKRLQEQGDVDEQINSLKLALQIREKALEDSEMQNVDLQRKVKDLDRLLSESKTKLQTIIDDQKKQITARDDKVKQLNNEVSKLVKQVNDKDMEMAEIKAAQADISNEELAQLREENERLLKELEEAREKEKQARFKAGQMFLNALKEKKASNDNSDKNLGSENLSDDEAIIRLYQALRNNPPSLLKRMQDADIDGDNKLTQSEFMLFLEKLRLSPQDIQSLCRVAGFMDGKKLLEIKDFRNILEERPRMREIWERKLFKRILDSIKAKGLTVDRVFQLIDIDNNAMVTPMELRNGLESLKIILNQKDFNNLFTIFDVDKNGILSLTEIKNTLLEYEGKSPDVDISFADRLSRDEFDVGQKLSSANDVYVSNSKEANTSVIKFTEDVEPIDGDLKVQVPYAKSLIDEMAIKQITIRVMLRGSEEPDVFKSIILFDTASWNYAVRIPIRSVLKENVNDDLLIQLFSSETFNEANFLGESKIVWKYVFDAPNTWVISQEFSLINQSFKKEISKQVTGSIAVQLKWIPASSKEFKGKLVERDMLVLDNATFVKTIVERGMVEFVLVSAFLQEKKQGLRCAVRTPNKKETVHEAKYDAKGNPFWSQKQLIEMEPQAERVNDSIRVTIYYEEGTLFKTKYVIGDVFIDWEECVQFPGEYLTKKSYLFKQHPHVLKPSKVYVQMRWIPESMYRAFGGFKQGSLKDRKNDIKASKEDLKEGILKVLLVRAKDLRGDDSVDSSDPYVKLLFENYDKEIQIRSKTKKYTVNPVWNQILQMKIAYYKDGVIPPLKVELWDEDSLGDDSLGSFVLDLTPTIESPCIWAIDDYFNVEDPKFKAQPSSPDARPKIYLQTYFVPEGTADPNVKPKDKENLLQIRDENTICGVLKVKLIHARGIRKADRKGSDPFVQLNFPGNKELKSSTISNTLNPQWNETFLEKILISKDRMAPLKFIVKDSDLFASDDILGYANVDWSKCAEEPGTWSVNNIFELEGTSDIKQKAGSLGFIYVQIKFIEEGMIDDQSNPPLIENLAQMIAEQQGLYKGTLRVFLVHCKDIVKADDGKNDFSDAYVVFKVPGGKEVKSNVIKDDQYPTWKQIYNIPMFMPKNTIQPMRVEVLDDDFIGKDMIGYANLDMLEALNNPQKWAINKVFPLDGDSNMRTKYATESFGSIYVQMMFVVDGITNEDPPLPLLEDLDEIVRKRKEQAKVPMRGTIVVNVVMAQNLKGADSSTKTSDSYVEIKFPDKKTATTQVIDKNINPIWNFEHRHRIDIYQEAYLPLQFKVLDKDTMAIDDVLGIVSVEWKDCFENPTMWRVNEFFDITGETVMGENLGKLYVQVKFLRDTDLETVEGQAACRTLESLQEEFGRVIGKLHVQIVSGANLKNTDMLGKSDPYVKAFLSNDQANQLKTPVVKDNLNPEWKFSGVIPINLLRCQIRSAELFFDVFDEDNVSDEMIGRVVIDVIMMLENPNKETSFEDVIADIKQKEGTNYGTLRTILKWEPSNECETVTGLRIPDPIMKGNLFVKAVNARGIKNQATFGTSDPFVQLSLNLFSKSVYKSKVFDNNLNPDFNFEQVIPLELTMKKARTLRLNMQIRDDDAIGSSALCGVTIALAEYYQNPGKWLSEYLELRDDDGNPKAGHTFIQLQWRQTDPAPQNPIDETIPAVMDYQAFLKQGEPTRYPGKLAVNVIAARKLKSSAFDKSDPFCEVKVSKGEKKVIKTKVIDDNENPKWNHSDEFTLDLTEEEWGSLKLYATVFDYDLAMNDKLGSIEIQLKDYFYNKERPWFDQILPLLDEKSFPGAGELYLQFQWRPTGETVNTVAPESKFSKEESDVLQKIKDELQKKVELAQEPFVKGKLYIGVVAARNLLNIDTFGASDPFVQIQFDFNKISINTPTITDNLDPKWNYSIEQDIQYQPTQLKDPNVMFTVYDYDYNSNDFLGQMIVRIEDLIKNPGTWFNEIQQLQDAKCTRGKCGIFYAQIQWRPEGVQVDTTLPPLISIEQFYKGVSPIGTVVIAAMGAKNILGVENKGKHSDAILFLKFNNKTLETKKISSLNPEWKEIFKFQINFKDRSLLPFLYCEVKDWNFVNNKFLGDFECDISQILEKPNCWCIEKEFALNNLKSQKVPDTPTGTVYLKIGFLEKAQEGMNLPI